MTLPHPPEDLRPIERTVWKKVATRGMAEGWWRPSDIFIVEVLAREAALYIELRRSLRGIPQNQIDPALVRDLEEMHQFVRKLMADCLLLPAGRVALVPLDDSGEDAEIVALAEIGRLPGGEINPPPP